MKVSFKNTLDDYVAAQAFELERWPRFADAILAWRWGFAAAAAVLGGTLGARASSGAGVGVAVAAAVAVYVWYPGYAKRRYLDGGRAMLNERDSLPFLTSERTLELTDEGLRSQSLAGEQLMRWAFLKSVDEGEHHVFIRARTGLGFVIPKNAVTSADKDALVEGIRRRLHAREP